MSMKVRQLVKELHREMRRCYLTRSANVTGLLGRAASLLISSSAICAEAGGCDQLGEARGNVAVEVYRRVSSGLGFTRVLKALVRSFAICTSDWRDLTEAQRLNWYRVRWRSGP